MRQQVNVVHVGLVGDYPGGMAQVVRRMLCWSEPGLKQMAISTTRRRHDPLWPVLTMAAIIHLAWLVASRNVDVLCVHVSEGGSFLREGAVARIAKAMRVPIVLHLHGADFETYAQSQPNRVRRVLKISDRILSLTRGSADAVVLLDPGSRSRVHLVRNSIDVSKVVSYQQRLPVILFVGEVGYRKGIDTLLSAWKELSSREALSGWSLRVIGPIAGDANLPKETALKAMRIQTLGTLPNALVAQHQTEAAIAVLPSRAEALPVTLIESMAQGCAVVASAVGQVPELLADGAGVLVEPGEPTDLAESLAQLMTDEAARTAVAERGHNRVASTYSSEAVAPTVISHWRAVIRRG